MVKILITAITVSFLSGCSAPSPYQKNLTRTTGANSQYLQNKGYKIISIDKNTGFIEAVNKNSTSQLGDSFYEYPTTSNISYKSINTTSNTSSGGYSISSVTAYLINR
jgi:hypothetical protein